MINYAIDDIKFESNDIGYHIHVKGWILNKDYQVVVKEGSKEIYRFCGNQKRYDICIAYHVDITEDDYGFDVEFDVPKECSLLEFKYFVDNQETRFFTLALDQKKHHQETLNNLLDNMKRSLKSEWETNHFKLPIVRLTKGFFKYVFGKSHDRLFDPNKEEEYQEWLKIQKYKKTSFKDYTIVHEGDVLHLETIDCSYVCFVGKNCELYSQFEWYVKKCIDYDVLYFDHDNQRRNPMFKPDYSYDTLHCVNYIGHVFVVKKVLLEEFDGKKIDCYQLLLTLSEKTKSFGHVSKVLYSDSSEVEYHDSKNILDSDPSVSIIIPTKDHIDDLKICIDSIIKKSSYQNYEIIVINNNSEKEESFEYFKRLNEKDNIQVIDLNCEFNFSYLNNYAVKNVSKGEYVLMLNNDTEVVSSDWLEQMLVYASKEGVGSVGAFLMFPDKTIQHAGIVMGKGGIAGHAYSGVSVDTEGYGYSLKVPYDVSCCTAACLMSSKKKYLEVGGLDEELKVAFNDVDYGLKLMEAGYRNVFLPNVKLYHYESKSRGMDKSAEQLKRYYSECDTMKERWNAYIEKDPFYNENFSRDDDYLLHE